MIDRGTRYKCYKCETGFYDLCRPQPICPSCGEDQNNREVVHAFKRKKRRSYSKMDKEIHVLHEESEGLHEHEEREDLHEHDHEDGEHLSGHEDEEKDEYILDKEDIAIEENTDGEDSN